MSDELIAGFFLALREQTISEDYDLYFAEVAKREQTSRANGLNESNGWMKPSGEVYRPEQTRLWEVGPDGELVVVADEDEWAKRNPDKVKVIRSNQYVFADQVKDFQCDGPVCTKSDFYKWLMKPTENN